MRTRSTTALALVLLAGATLTACGGSTKTVTAESQSSSSQSPPSTSSTGTTGTSAPSSSGATGENGSGSTGQSTTPSQTRTATEPQFDQGQSQTAPQEAQQAATVVRAHGYTPDNLSEYHPSQTLRTLVGTRSGSADGYGQQVFFFVDGRFIGTDTKEPSASLKVVSQDDTEAVVAYRLYRPGDPLSSPSGGQVLVHFQLNNGMLVPVGTIPPVHSSSAPSRL